MLKVASVVIWTVGVLALSIYMYLWYDYQQNKPTMAQPSLGRVHPMYMRGVTVYLTQAETTRLDLCGKTSFACVLAGFVVFALMQRQQRRLDEQR